MRAFIIFYKMDPWTKTDGQTNRPTDRWITPIQSHEQLTEVGNQGKIDLQIYHQVNRFEIHSYLGDGNNS